MAQLRVNSRLLNPEFLADDDLYEFARLTPEQFEVLKGLYSTSAFHAHAITS